MQRIRRVPPPKADPHTLGAPLNIKLAIDRAREAREFLRRAGAHNAAAYVARALKSIEGALRHAESGRR